MKLKGRYGKKRTFGDWSIEGEICRIGKIWGGADNGEDISFRYVSLGEYTAVLAGIDRRIGAPAFPERPYLF